jgi:hypothetical protein
VVNFTHRPPYPWKEPGLEVSAYRKILFSLPGFEPWIVEPVT